MSKYIIKNCPAQPSDIKASFGWCGTKQIKCQICTDCLLKQIVKKCKEAQDKEYRKGSYKFRSPSKAAFGREILQLMDIEEI